MDVILELFICANTPQGGLRYHRLCRDITVVPTDPDDILSEMLDRLGIYAKSYGVVAHSTSWRYETGKTLLTYLVWINPSVLDELPTRQLSSEALTSNAIAAGPLSPRPREIDEVQVLAHGLGHLRYLFSEKREPFVCEAIAACGAVEMIHRIPPMLSGRLA